MKYLMIAFFLSLPMVSNASELSCEQVQGIHREHSRELQNLVTQARATKDIQLLRQYADRANELHKEYMKIVPALRHCWGI